MDDDSVPLPNHVTCRDGVYQYVRRVPDDVADAFASTRIQRSLKTRVPGEARLRAAQLDQDIERQFAEARRLKGRVLEPLSTASWTWKDWSTVIAWLKAQWLHEDQQARHQQATGANFAADYQGKPLWLHDKRLREQIDLRKRLLAMTPADYAADRSASLNRSLSKLQIAAPNGPPYRNDFMTGCLKAEVQSLDIILRREAGDLIEHVHPDSIDGPWRRVTAAEAQEAEPNEALPAERSRNASKMPDRGEPSRSLSNCIDEWIKERIRLKKKVDSHLVNDMRNTIVWFGKFTKATLIVEVRRRHIIAFRDHLFDKGEYKAATVNKKVGYLTTLMSLAASKGWVESAIEGGIYIEIPSDEDKRDSYSRDELATLFASPVFTLGKRSASIKAGGELQFWLPLIACCHGLISSEILQLGPDTIVQHPGSDVWCFRVTNAGGRSIKAFSRERYVPVRTELIEAGLLKTVAEARRKNWSTIWESMEIPGRTVSNVSNYFSAYWTHFARKQLGETPARKSLYSLRHAFKDELDRRKVPLEIKQALMGHVDFGTTGRYGTKSQPRSVNVRRLQSVVQSLEWDFLKNLPKLD